MLIVGNVTNIQRMVRIPILHNTYYEQEQKESSDFTLRVCLNS